MHYNYNVIQMLPVFTKLFLIMFVHNTVEFDGENFDIFDAFQPDYKNFKAFTG